MRQARGDRRQRLQYTDPGHRLGARRCDSAGRAYAFLSEGVENKGNDRLGMRAEVAHLLSDGADPVGVEETEGEITQDRQDIGAMGAMDEAGILGQTNMWRGAVDFQSASERV